MSEKIYQPNSQRPRIDVYRILVLDKPEHIDQLRVAAQKAGHEVVAVTTIAEAMHFLDTRNHVDVVISAVHLQHESVFDFLKQMKESPVHFDVAFMMICSGPSELALAVNESVKLAASFLGVDKYLTMPEYDVNRLMKEITAILPDAPPLKETDPEGSY